jgi:peptidoglycan-associated lipoprotein
VKRVIAVAVLGLFALGLGACGSKRKPAIATEPPGQGQGRNGAGVPDRAPTEPVNNGPDVVPLNPEGGSGVDLDNPESSPLADIHFEYDKSALTDEARSTLESHAAWLKDHRGTRVTVEGHCDERGTAEYNLALGDQRARTTREYLVSLGVEAARLQAVSLGKERPLDPSRSEAAYAKNRRAHFAVAR